MGAGCSGFAGAMKVCLVGDVDGVALNGVSGRLVLMSSKSDRLEDGRVMTMVLDIVVFSGNGDRLVVEFGDVFMLV